MPTKKIERPQETYQIKITLLGTRPPIWRRLMVPASMTLAQLHDVLQAAMGWEKCHLHEFRIGRQRFGVPDPDDRLMGGPGCVNERKVRLSEVLGKTGAKAEYTYDFGDSWEHGIAVEKVLTAEPGLVLPVCTDCRHDGPPEDCGGLGGYYNFLEAIRDPAHDEHEEMLEWIGSSFDPESFSPAAVNQRLQQKEFHFARKATATHTRGSEKRCDHDPRGPAHMVHGWRDQGHCRRRDGRPWGLQAVQVVHHIRDVHATDPAPDGPRTT